MRTYPIAPNGIFKTIQGEGTLLGLPMSFVRLAGCSVGCSQCDTDYRVDERLEASQIGNLVRQFRTKWTWITGGEPADHELWPLLEEMRLCGYVALATSGTKSLGSGGRIIDFLSVSPHSTPDKLVIRSAAQINLVPGLNDLRLEDWESYPFDAFQHRYVTPCDGLGNLNECLAWIDRHDGFRLGVQVHKIWGLP